MNAVAAYHRDTADRNKARQAIVSTAPKFSGTSSLEFWQRTLRAHLAISGCEEVELIRVAPLCLEGTARDYYYSTGIAVTNLEEFFEVLQLRYGLA